MRVSDQPFELLFQKSPYPAAIFDLETLAYLAVNDAAVRTYGYSRKEFLKMTIKDIRPAEEIPAALAYLARNIQGRVPRTHDGRTWKHLKKDGGVIDVELMLFHVFYGGRRAGLAVAQDVTRRRELQAKLQLFRDLMEQSNDAVFIVDPRTGRFQDFNERAVQWLGYSRAELRAIGVRDVAVSLAEPSAWRRLAARARRRGGIIGEDYARRKGGSTFPVEMSARLISKGRARYLVALLRDIRARRKMEREILEIGEEERRRVGRELHDGLGQTLTAVGLLWSALKSRCARRGPEDAELLREMSEAVQHACSQARDIGKLLLPADLWGGEIVAALRLLARHVSAASGIPCEVEVSGAVRLREGLVSINLFRIAQEAINNAVKHGEAGRLRVRIAGSETCTELVVSDDGRGLVLPKERSRLGSGLRQMRYRAGVIGASLEVKSSAGRGTRVRCVVPRGGLPVAAGLEAPGSRGDASPAGAARA